MYLVIYVAFIIHFMEPCLASCSRYRAIIKIIGERDSGRDNNIQATITLE